jgi:sugar O-acyltransferase (sialic acid O-acetyltransferase NeuD family)
MPNILIVGAGGHGRVVLDIVRQAGRFHPLGFLDADVDLAGSSIDGVKVLGPLNLLPRLLQQGQALHAVIAIGDNRARRSCAAKVAAAGIELASAIHPTAVISPNVKIGRNVVIAAGAIVGVETQVGDSVIINTGAIIDHECRIGQGVHICPGAKLAGRVQIDVGAFIGLGAAVIQCRRVGAEAIVGAGAVVIHDVPAGATVVGVPARTIKTAGHGGEFSPKIASI